MAENLVRQPAFDFDPVAARLVVEASDLKLMTVTVESPDHTTAFALLGPCLLMGAINWLSETTFCNCLSWYGGVEVSDTSTLLLLTRP
jgi:hypothetical protein